MGSNVWDKVPNKYVFFLTPSLMYYVPTSIKCVFPMCEIIEFLLVVRSICFIKTENHILSMNVLLGGILVEISIDYPL